MCDPLALYPHLFDAIQLSQPDGCGQISEVVLEADIVDLVVPGAAARVPPPCVSRKTVEPHGPGAMGNIGRVGQEHPALARRDGLGRVEAECAGGSHSAGGSAVAAARYGVGRILDDRQVSAAGEFHDGVHLGHHAAEMNDHDRPGLRPQLRLDRLRGDVESDRVYVGQPRPGVQVADRFAARRERVRGHHNFVAGPDPKCLENQVQCSGGRVDRDGVATAEAATHGFLKRDCLLAGSQPARVEHLQHRLALGCPDGWSVELDTSSRTLTRGRRRGRMGIRANHP